MLEKTRRNDEDQSPRTHTQGSLDRNHGMFVGDA